MLSSRIKIIFLNTICKPVSNLTFDNMSQSEEKIILSPKLQQALDEITRGTEEVLPLEELKKKLVQSEKIGIPLKIKAGFDPTAPDLHLGHTVLLQKLKTFQTLGHDIYFLIGDYTAMIGDPTGKSETRPKLTLEQVLENAETYKEQVFKILDPKKTKVVFNSSWLEKLHLKDVLDITSRYTVARMLERDDFSKRYASGVSISLVEFLYPLMQGYDSVALEADVELGGTDQKFNLLVGRNLQASYDKSAQVILTMPLLVGLDGSKKMSKSLGNYVSIQEPALEIFGKLMSISDSLMWTYYILLGDEPLTEIENLKKLVEQGKLHPKECKSDLALQITTRFHSPKEALMVKEEWNNIHSAQKTGLPSQIEKFEYKLTGEDGAAIGLLNVLRLAKLCQSNSDARRGVESGAVYEIDITSNEEKRQQDLKRQLFVGDYIFRFGKRKFRKIKIS